ncbi:MAG: GAF domain-containing protein [Chloroflexi bacterium]|nr:GAF domain-containing protein [Chloroflexota bacterium]
MSTDLTTPKMDYYRALYEVARTVNSSLSLPQVLQRVVESTAKALHAKGCLLRLLDPMAERLDFSASYGLSSEYIAKGPVEVRKSGVDAEALAGRALVVARADEDPRLQYPEEVRREGIASMLIVPVTAKGAVIGVLRVYTAEPRIFDDEDVRFVESIANLGGIAIENARVYMALEEQLAAIRRKLIPWAENFSKPAWRG